VTDDIDSTGKTTVVFFSTPIFGESLKITKLDGERFASDNCGGFRELMGSLKFPVRMMMISALFALGLGLFCHRFSAFPAAGPPA